MPSARRGAGVQVAAPLIEKQKSRVVRGTDSTLASAFRSIRERGARDEVRGFSGVGLGAVGAGE
jgi:hypothetical protein